MPQTITVAHKRPLPGFISQDTLAARVNALPRLPLSYQVWLQLMSSTAVDGNLDVAIPIIARDPGLTVKLLALANSVEFRAEEPASTLETAVFRLGTLHTLRLVAAIVFRETTHDGLPLYGMTQADFLTHTNCTSHFMASFASKAGIAAAEGQSLGAIRGMGQWLLQQSMQNAAVTIPAFTGHYMEAPAWEHQMFDADHAAFVVGVLRQYHMPDLLTEPVAQYLNPQPGAWYPQAALLQVATCHATAFAFPNRARMDTSRLAALQADLGISDKAVHLMAPTFRSIQQHNAAL